MSMSRLKIKIKLPKLLLKPKNLLSKHINSFVSHAFSGKKPQEASSSTGKNHSLRECLEEQETKMICHPVTHQDPSYCKSLSFKEFVKDPGTEGKKRKLFKKISVHRSSGKQPLIVSSSFSNLLRKKTRFSFIKWKMNKTRNVNIDQNHRIISYSSNSDNLTVKQKTAKDLSSGQRNIKYARWMQKEEVEHEDRRDRVKDKSWEIELCKKRILMGEKCKPLNISGTLQYDETGILLPEDIRFSSDY